MNVRPLDSEKGRAMRVVLKAAYDAVLSEPVPESIHDVLRRVK